MVKVNIEELLKKNNKSKYWLCNQMNITSHNLNQIILGSVTDIKEGEEEKFYSLYKIFEDDKNFSIIDKYLFVKVLLNPKNKFKYNLSQINDIFYFIKKVSINAIFVMKENIDFHKIFKILWLTSLLNKNGKKYVDDMLPKFEQNESFTIENIDKFLSHIEYDDNEQLLVNIIESINHHKIKFNEFEEIYKEEKSKIKLKDLFNVIIDKVFEKIFGEFDNAEEEILNAKKIFKNADWNMETFRYMCDTCKREKPFLFYSLDNKNDKDIINKAYEIICLFQLSDGNEIIDILEDIYNNNPDKWEEKWILELNKLAALKIKKETQTNDQSTESYLKDIFFCNKKEENGKSFLEKENINENNKLRLYLVSSEQKYNQFLESIKDWDTIQCVDWINDNRHLFNVIIDKVFENIFGEFDNAEKEILNAKKIFKNADWNMESFRYMVDTNKREKPFLFYSLDNKNDKDIINKACEIICLFQLSNGNDIIDIFEDVCDKNPEKWILELN